MKRMMACAWADSPDSYLSTTNHRHNKIQIALGEADHSETAYNSGALTVVLGYAYDRGNAIPPRFDASAPSGNPTKTSAYGVLRNSFNRSPICDSP